MKKTLIITKLALGALVIAGTAACNQPKTDTAAKTAPAAADKPEIVYVNADSLYTKYSYAKDVDQKMNDKGKSAQADLQSKGEAFQREVADYQKNAATLSADQRQTKEQSLQREQQNLQAYQQNASAQFQQEKATEYQKVYDKVADYVKQYAKDKGYKMVLTYTKAGQTVIYGDPSLDVTNDVLKGLNDAYNKSK